MEELTENLLLIFILMSLVSLYYIKEHFKHKKIQIQIFKNILPRKVELVDIIMYKIESDNGTLECFLPVLKDLSNEKKYIPGLNSYDYICIHEDFINKKLIIKNLKDKKLELGDIGRIYIKKEQNNINIVDNKVKIEYDIFSIGKNIEEANYKMEYEKLYNYNKNNKLDIILKDVIVFSGIVDFDIDGILYNHVNKK